MMVDKIDSLSFEDGYDLLERVIQKLEQGDLSLDDSVALYEEGMLLAAHCGRQLDDAEIKISELLVAANDDLEQDDLGESADL
jgi:exodeoxyribonuclease VII small subunit